MSTEFFFISSTSSGNEALGPLSIEQATSAVYEEYGSTEAVERGGEVRSVEGTESDLDAGRVVHCRNVDMKERAVAFSGDDPPTVSKLADLLEVDREEASELLHRCEIYDGETFRLEIRLGNAEMRSRADVARELRAVAGNIVESGFGGSISDPNGNHVGTCGLGALPELVE